MSSGSIDDFLSNESRNKFQRWKPLTNDFPFLVWYIMNVADEQQT